MVYKKFWLRMLVTVLLFGMTVLGCDNGTTGNGADSALNGTWIWQEGTPVNFNWEINNGNFETTMNGTLHGRGTFSTSGNIFSLVNTHFYGISIRNDLEARWYTISELNNLGIVTMVNQEHNYKLNGNTLTFFWQAGGSAKYSRF